MVRVTMTSADSDVSLASELSAVYLTAQGRDVVAPTDEGGFDVFQGQPQQMGSLMRPIGPPGDRPWVPLFFITVP